MAARKAFDQLSRRPLTRSDYLLGATLALIGVPITASLVLNRKARQELEPTLAAWRQRWDTELAPEFWLSLERLSGREGEYSERLRRNAAAKRGVEYVPKVILPSPFEGGTAPGAAAAERKGKGN